MGQRGTRNSRDLVSEIREKTDLVNLVQESGIELRPKGGRYWACCPFHQEKTASFSIRPEMGYYYCFGCHSSGDVIKFTMKSKNFEFKEAVEYLGKRAGISVEFSKDPQVIAKKKLEKEKKEIIYQVLQETTDFYRGIFHDNWGNIARDYVSSRGISEETSEIFQLGYAPIGWTLLTDHLLRNGFSPEILVESGVSAKSEKNPDRPYDRFRGRLIFPILDENGRIISFAGRDLETEKNEHTPKYINGTESLVFKKGEVLYGFNFAFKPIQKSKELVVVEGYVDVIHSHQEGFENVAATCGTSFTDEHLNFIQRRFPNLEELIFAFDADTGGINAAINAGKKSLGKIPSYVVLFPEKEDPASLLEKGESGKKKLKERLEARTPFVDFYFGEKSRGKELGTFEGKLALLEEITSDIVRGAEFKSISLLLDSFACKIGIPREDLIPFFVAEDNGWDWKDNKDVAYWEERLLGQLTSFNFGDLKYLKEFLSPKLFSTDERKVCFEYLQKEGRDVAESLPLFEEISRGSLREGIILVSQERGISIDQNVLEGLIRRLERFKHEPVMLESLEHTLLMLEAQRVNSSLMNSVRRVEFQNGGSQLDLLRRLREMDHYLKTGK